MNGNSGQTAVVIVGFRNPQDILDCVNALALATPTPSFDIFICENGGKEAFEQLISILTTAEGPCVIYPENREIPRNTYLDKFADIKSLALKGRPTLVWTACAISNLGYAGAINAWIKRLRTIDHWDGIWVLNPDTKPYPDALANLVQRAVTGNKGMVSSTLVFEHARDQVHNRGLRWNKIEARTVSIGHKEFCRSPCDENAIEAIMDGPSGASMYVTRACLEKIGLMDERFFLYHEDTDWGIRAKKCGLGYAVQSVVPHKGGTTIGSSSVRRANRSPLSVYLESRNRLLLVQKHFPWLSAYASLMSFAYAFVYLCSGSRRNFKVTLEGIFAAWSGETGPPPDAYDGHLRAVFSELPKALFQKAKLAISLAWYCGQVIWHAALRTSARSPAPRLIILYYHGVEDSYRFEFARQMDVLLDLAHVVPADFNGVLLSDKINVAITFDDAFESVADNALPELACRSFHSTIFVPVGVLGREPNWHIDDSSMTDRQVVMTAERLKALDPALVAIGSHGLFHFHLSALDEDQAKADIDRSRHELEALVGREVNLFAFPYGDYDERVLELCKSAGYRYVYCTVLMRRDARYSNFLRDRVKADPSDSPMEFFLKIHGAYSWTDVIRAIAIRLWYGNRANRSGLIHDKRNANQNYKALMTSRPENSELCETNSEH